MKTYHAGGPGWELGTANWELVTGNCERSEPRELRVQLCSQRTDAVDPVSRRVVTGNRR